MVKRRRDVNSDLKQYCVSPLEKEKIQFAEDGETAYELKESFIALCKNEDEKRAQLEEAPCTPDTLGYEIIHMYDYFPYELITYTADKKLNAEYTFGGHLPGEDRYQQACRFQIGEKVLCVIHQGYNFVIPAIVIGPFSEDVIKQWFDELPEVDDYEHYVECFTDWDWDAVMVRPLVRVEDEFGLLGDTLAISRVYVFPYRKFEL